MAGRTAWILGDQLSHENPALRGADRALLVESATYLRGPRLHRQKLHLVYAAMRHFAGELAARGLEVDLRAAPTLKAGVAAHVAEYDPDEVGAWARGRRRLVMEDFYRWQRTRLGVLMDGDEPAGGRWNLDAENRRPPARPAPAPAVPPA